ncbi:MAG TPA: DUF4199 domain-containing protein [Chryseosolibacter sp.]|nr:DUF4199 domain-containing protein [Chryseosolibacter sp.]
MKPLHKVPVIFGSIAGVLGTALFIGIYYIGPHPFLIPPYSDFRILFFAVFIFFTLKEIRDLHQGGILYFWQGLIASFIFVGLYAVICSAIIGTFAEVNDEFVRSYVEQKTAELKTYPADIVEKIGKEVYQRNLQMLPSTNGFKLASLYLTQSFIIGAFVSIILSVILRRQPNP